MYTLGQVKEIIDSEFPLDEIEELAEYLLDSLPNDVSIALIKTYLKENE